MVAVPALPKDLPAPPSLRGRLWLHRHDVASMPALQKYQLRFVAIEGARLYWWASGDEAEEMGLEGCRGSVDFIANACVMEAEEQDAERDGKEGPTRFSLRPVGGRWVGSHFAGAAQGRMLRFDVADSENNRTQWMSSLRAHISHGEVCRGLERSGTGGDDPKSPGKMRALRNALCWSISQELGALLAEDPLEEPLQASTRGSIEKLTPLEAGTPAGSKSFVPESRTAQAGPRQVGDSDIAEQDQGIHNHRRRTPVGIAARADGAGAMVAVEEAAAEEANRLRSDLAKLLRSSTPTTLAVGAEGVRAGELGAILAAEGPAGKALVTALEGTRRNVDVTATAPRPSCRAPHGTVPVAAVASPAVPLAPKAACPSISSHGAAFANPDCLEEASASRERRKAEEIFEVTDTTPACLGTEEANVSKRATARAGLVRAIGDRDVDELRVAIDVGEQAELCLSELRPARAALAEEEDRATAKSALQNALATRDSEMIRQGISQCIGSGFDAAKLANAMLAGLEVESLDPISPSGSSPDVDNSTGACTLVTSKDSPLELCCESTLLASNSCFQALDTVSTALETPNESEFGFSRGHVISAISDELTDTTSVASESPLRSTSVVGDSTPHALGRSFRSAGERSPPNSSRLSPPMKLGSSGGMDRISSVSSTCAATSGDSPAGPRPNPLAPTLGRSPRGDSCRSPKPLREAQGIISNMFNPPSATPREDNIACPDIGRVPTFGSSEDDAAVPRQCSAAPSDRFMLGGEVCHDAMEVTFGASGSGGRALGRFRARSGSVPDLSSSDLAATTAATASSTPSRLSMLCTSGLLSPRPSEHAATDTPAAFLATMLGANQKSCGTSSPSGVVCSPRNAGASPQCFFAEDEGRVAPRHTAAATTRGTAAFSVKASPDVGTKVSTTPRGNGSTPAMTRRRRWDSHAAGTAAPMAGTPTSTTASSTPSGVPNGGRPICRRGLSPGPNCGAAAPSALGKLSKKEEVSPRQPPRQQQLVESPGLLRPPLVPLNGSMPWL